MAWDQMLSIIAENDAEIKTFKSQRPVACPNDGEPLKLSPANVLYCPSDGWMEDGSYYTGPTQN